ncbi:Eukaryotic translation initiation factor 3 subunit I [Chionoecetes opilio]|uniref:Serine-threonine kinase receptor-associated protein n=1 Tax=Chionoecetes opilio TaxID=41210 RepID=A0A8J4Y232_CHIOP|nr:Eukaryotic translation initiation factor 3 subunit I [Chionoecetes opilio]
MFQDPKYAPAAPLITTNAIITILTTTTIITITTTIITITTTIITITTTIITITILITITTTLPLVSRIWDVETGACNTTLEMKTSVRGVGFSYSGTMIAYTTDKMMGHNSELSIIDVREPNNVDSTPIMKTQVTPSNTKALSVLWGPLDEYVVTGHEDGSIIKWDMRTGKKIEVGKEHTKQIKDMQLSHDGMMLITASMDTTARLWDITNLEALKLYKTDRPVNSAAISPLVDTYPHVVMGGGQEAMDVTTTSSRIGKFDARFFHLVFEDEFARVKGHFGPINSIRFHPNGRGYASGGEDGYVRVHVFDDAYYQFKFDF